MLISEEKRGKPVYIGLLTKTIPASSEHCKCKYIYAGVIFQCSHYFFKLITFFRINADPDLEIKTSEGETPLLRAVLARNAEIVELLLDKKRKLIHATNNKGGKKKVCIKKRERFRFFFLRLYLPLPLGEKTAIPSSPSQIHVIRMDSILVRIIPKTIRKVTDTTMLFDF